MGRIPPHRQTFLFLWFTQWQGVRANIYNWMVKIVCPWTVNLCLSCTVKPRFTNASDYEQLGLRTNFPNTKRLGWLLCLKLRTRKPSTSWSDKLGVSSSEVFVEEWSSGKYPESATPIGESVSCCVETEKRKRIPSKQ